MALTVAGPVVHTFADAEVNRPRGVTGDRPNAINDSLRWIDAIDWVPAHHENTASAPDDAVFTGDVDTPAVRVARYPIMNRHRRLLGSFHHGFMPNAVRQTIGTPAAVSEWQVVSLSGDAR